MDEFNLEEDPNDAQKNPAFFSETLGGFQEQHKRISKAFLESEAHASMVAAVSEAAMANIAPALIDFSNHVKCAFGGIGGDTMWKAFGPGYRDGWLDESTRSSIESLAKTQQDLISQSLASYQTPAIEKMLESFKRDDLFTGFESLSKGLSSSVIMAPDLALFGKVDGLTEAFESFGRGDSIPPGMKTFVKSLSRASLDRLAVASDLRVDLKAKSLFLNKEGVGADGEAASDAGKGPGVSAITFNVITSSLSMFNDLTEADMIELQQLCFDEPAFARECKAGALIWRVIKDWRDLISFDCDFYYHARLKKAEAAPFLKDDMEKAPRSFVRCGRFNPPEKAYYYFSNSEYGAMREVGKHGDGNEVQVAKLVGKGVVRLLDLSDTGRETNYFLKYVRFPFTNSNSVIPPEYLVPNFVAQCCRHAGIDGIKYYGSKKHNNYVVWDDGKLEMVSTYVIAADKKRVS